MKVFVIGSNGYIGRHLLNNLLCKGVDAVGLSSKDGTGIDPVSGILSNDFVIPSGVSSVVYLSQSPYHRNIDLAPHVLAVNALSAVKAAAASRIAGVKRFIYISTGTVYSPSFEKLSENSSISASDLYTLSKIQGEQAIQLYSDDMEIIIVRLFGVYGSGQSNRLVPNLIKSIRTSNPIILQPKDGYADQTDGLRISLIHVNDASAVLTHLIENGGPPVINVASDKFFSIRNLADMIGSYMSIKPEYCVSESNRRTDLIADIGKLTSLYEINFIPIENGLGSVIDFESKQ